jgi:hypothetical protein
MSTVVMVRQRPTSKARGKDAEIHRPFFRAAIAVVLSAGAAWGSLLLWRIALAGSFTAVSIHSVNAHGHAQIFGWVGLFVMGFAYRMLARIRVADGVDLRIAKASLVLMVAGIAARSVGEPLHDFSLMRWMALAGAAAEIVAIAGFAAVVVAALRNPGRPMPAERPYVIAALICFLAQAIYEGWLLIATTAAETREHLLGLVATWQAPLRDLQIHGFALMMILGVGLWLFPRTFRLPQPPTWLVRWGWILILMAVAGEIGGFLAMRATGRHAWGGLLYLSILLLAGTSVALTWRWLPWSGQAREERSVKYIRAAVVWLAISMTMLVLAPVYNFAVLPNVGQVSPSGQRAIEIGFSHAYYGAIRHAITVGFISLTIMGVAARIVPMLGGQSTRGLQPLWLPFAIINVGCAIRVSLQVASDIAQPAFALIGLSGVLEVGALALWGAHLLHVMGQRRKVGWTSRLVSRFSTTA